MNSFISRTDLEVEKIAAPRYGVVLIDAILSFAERKELLTFLLVLFTPIVFWVEHVLIPDHMGPELYYVLIFGYSLLFNRRIYIFLMAVIFIGLRYYTYSEAFTSHNLSMLAITSALYIGIGVFSLSALKILQEARSTEMKSIYSLLQTIQMRDHYTAQHSRNVAEKSVWIAKELNLYAEFQQNLYVAGLLHDIGKIAIPDAILIKPDSLTVQEYSEIKKHPQLGMDLLQHAPVMRNQTIRDAILYHHERFDGNGYPTGLIGEEIPLSARIMAIADTYDAMTTNRVYQRKRSPEEALRIIKENAGTQFDPKLVTAFTTIMQKKLPEMRNVVSM